MTRNLRYPTHFRHLLCVCVYVCVCVYRVCISCLSGISAAIRALADFSKMSSLIMFYIKLSWLLRKSHSSTTVSPPARLIYRSLFDRSLFDRSLFDRSLFDRCLCPSWRCTHTLLHAHTHVHTHTRTCTRTNTHTYTLVYTHTHTHTHTHTCDLPQASRTPERRTLRYTNVYTYK